MTRRVVTIQVEEGGGVPLSQFAELSNTLAAMPPGWVIVTIETLYETAGGDPYA